MIFYNVAVACVDTKRKSPRTFLSTFPRHFIAAFKACANVGLLLQRLMHSCIFVFNQEKSQDFS